MPDVQTPPQFLDDFLKRAKLAKKRIYLQSMLFETGEILSKLEPVLIKKAKEYIDIRINKDWVAQRYVHTKPYVIPAIKSIERKYNNGIHKQNEQIIKKWTNSGIIFTVTNIPHGISSLLSIAGRNHIKMYIVDDIAWIGGINLFDPAFQWIDIMVKFSDPGLISALAEQFFRVNSNKPKDNYSIVFSQQNTLLIDAGIRGKSLIYDESIQLVNKAKHSIIFASQFVPDGKILEAILTATRRGVAVTILTASKDYRNFTDFPSNIPFLFFKSKIKHNTNISLHHQRTIVHAKLLIVDEKSALFGSHNLVNIGVQLATEEIAIHTTDKNLVQQLLRFVETSTVRK